MSWIVLHQKQSKSHKNFRDSSRRHAEFKNIFEDFEQRSGKAKLRNLAKFRIQNSSFSQLLFSKINRQISLIFFVISRHAQKNHARQQEDHHSFFRSVRVKTLKKHSKTLFFSSLWSFCGEKNSPGYDTQIVFESSLV